MGNETEDGTLAGGTIQVAESQDRAGDALTWAQRFVYLALTIAFVSLLVFLTVTGWWSSLSGAQTQLLAVVLGGMLGGLTHAVVEEEKGQRYELRYPAHRSPDTPMEGVTRRWILDLGFVGQTFVGLMASGLVLGALSGATDLDLLEKVEDTEAILRSFFWHFAVAFLSGFLGIRLIRQMANNFSARIEEATTVAFAARTRSAEAMRVAEQSQVQSMFLKAREAIDNKEYAEAERLLQEMTRLEGASLRGLALLATIRRCQKNWPEAIRLLNEAIAMGDKEPMKSRVAAAYYNRACYRALMAAAPDVEAIVQDLRAAVKIDKEIAQHLQKDLDVPTEAARLQGDLHGVKDHPKVLELVQELQAQRLM